MSTSPVRNNRIGSSYTGPDFHSDLQPHEKAAPAIPPAAANLPGKKVTPMSTGNKILIALLVIASIALIVGASLGINGLAVGSYGYTSTSIPFLLTSAVLGITGFSLWAYNKKEEIAKLELRLDERRVTK